MADRTVYGHTHSENGWRMVDQGSCVWVLVPGTDVTLQIREGQPVKIMGAFAADFNAYVEPLRDADSACWTPTNSVATSNHLSGTGMDLNWNGPDGRTFRLSIPKERAYPGDKARKLDELLAFYEGMIFCGGNWSIRDWMHFQMGGQTYGSQHVEKVNDFIARKIRADGFSTFKRSGTPGPVTPPPAPPATPPASGNQVDVLARATGVSTEKAAQILVGVVNGLRDSQCTNVNRIAMWLAQMGHESAGFNATEEYANGDGGATERWLYKGRTWIQITWKSNYAGFSKWAYDNGFLRSPNYFVDHPTDLADMEWAGLGPAWYWTVARAQINSLCDRGDINEVTRLINGGYNGLDDRAARYRRALALGDQLLQLLTEGDDFMSALTDDEQRELLDNTRQIAKYRRPSLSPLRWPHEGDVNTCAGFAWSADGNVHVMLVEKLAVDYGDAPAIALLYAVANTDEPGRDADIQLANRILAKVAPADITVAQMQIKAWLDAEKAHQ